MEKMENSRKNCKLIIEDVLNFVPKKLYKILQYLYIHFKKNLFKLIIF